MNSVLRHAAELGRPVGLDRDVDRRPPLGIGRGVGERFEHRLARRIDVPLVDEHVLRRHGPILTAVASSGGGLEPSSPQDQNLTCCHYTTPEGRVESTTAVRRAPRPDRRCDQRRIEDLRRRIAEARSRPSCGYAPHADIATILSRQRVRCQRSAVELGDDPLGRPHRVDRRCLPGRWPRRSAIGMPDGADDTNERLAARSRSPTSIRSRVAKATIAAAPARADPGRGLDVQPQRSPEAPALRGGLKASALRALRPGRELAAAGGSA